MLVPVISALVLATAVLAAPQNGYIFPASEVDFILTAEEAKLNDHHLPHPSENTGTIIFPDQQIIQEPSEETTDATLNDDHEHEGVHHVHEGNHDHEGNHHHDGNHHHIGLDWLREAVPGEPGVDYPIYWQAPRTSFNCRDHVNGYYADIYTGCQVFHVCNKRGDRTFLCPNGTIFNQEHFTCQWWFNVDCLRAKEFYHLNFNIGAVVKGSQSTSNLKDIAHIQQEAQFPIETFAPVLQVSVDDYDQELIIQEQTESPAYESVLDGINSELVDQDVDVQEQFISNEQENVFGVIQHEIQFELSQQHPQQFHPLDFIQEEDEVTIIPIENQHTFEDQEQEEDAQDSFTLAPTEENDVSFDKDGINMIENAFLQSPQLVSDVVKVGASNKSSDVSVTDQNDSALEVNFLTSRESDDLIQQENEILSVTLQLEPNLNDLAQEDPKLIPHQESNLEFKSQDLQFAHQDDIVIREGQANSGPLVQTINKHAGLANIPSSSQTITDISQIQDTNIHSISQESVSFLQDELDFTTIQPKYVDSNDNLPIIEDHIILSDKQELAVSLQENNFAPHQIDTYFAPSQESLEEVTTLLPDSQESSSFSQINDDIIDIQQDLISNYQSESQSAEEMAENLLAHQDVVIQNKSDSLFTEVAPEYRPEHFDETILLQTETDGNTVVYERNHDTQVQREGFHTANEVRSEENIKVVPLDFELKNIVNNQGENSSISILQGTEIPLQQNNVITPVQVTGATSQQDLATTSAQVDDIDIQQSTDIPILQDTDFTRIEDSNIHTQHEAVISSEQAIKIPVLKDVAIRPVRQEAAILPIQETDISVQQSILTISQETDDALLIKHFDVPIQENIVLLPVQQEFHSSIQEGGEYANAEQEIDSQYASIEQIGEYDESSLQLEQNTIQPDLEPKEEHNLFGFSHLFSLHKDTEEGLPSVIPEVLPEADATYDVPSAIKPEISQLYDVPHHNFFIFTGDGDVSHSSQTNLESKREKPRNDDLIVPGISQIETDKDIEIFFGNPTTFPTTFEEESEDDDSSFLLPHKSDQGLIPFIHQLQDIASLGENTRLKEIHEEGESPSQLSSTDLPEKKFKQDLSLTDVDDSSENVDSSTLNPNLLEDTTIITDFLKPNNVLEKSDQEDIIQDHVSYEVLLNNNESEGITIQPRNSNYADIYSTEEIVETSTTRDYYDDFQRNNYLGETSEELTTELDITSDLEISTELTIKVGEPNDSFLRTEFSTDAPELSATDEYKDDNFHADEEYLSRSDESVEVTTTPSELSVKDLTTINYRANKGTIDEEKQTIVQESNVTAVVTTTEETFAVLKTVKEDEQTFSPEVQEITTIHPEYLELKNINVQGDEHTFPLEVQEDSAIHLEVQEVKNINVQGDEHAFPLEVQEDSTIHPEVQEVKNINVQSGVQEKHRIIFPQLVNLNEHSGIPKIDKVESQDLPPLSLSFQTPKVPTTLYQIPKKPQTLYETPVRDELPPSNHYLPPF